MKVRDLITELQRFDGDENIIATVDYHLAERVREHFDEYDWEPPTKVSSEICEVRFVNEKRCGVEITLK